MAAVGTVLIVDDEVDLCESIQFVFEDASYKAFLAHTVKGALDILARESIDFVVSDVRMPGESGIDLVKAMRETLNHKAVVFLISGYYTPQEDLAPYNVEDVIKKPINLDGLLEKVEAKRKAIKTHS